MWGNDTKQNKEHKKAKTGNIKTHLLSEEERIEMENMILDKPLYTVNHHGRLLSYRLNKGDRKKMSISDIKLKFGKFSR